MCVCVVCVEPYAGLMHKRLSDPCKAVRKNALMVLIHLILNDMLKVIPSLSHSLSLINM